jgi:hypothetical protein
MTGLLFPLSGSAQGTSFPVNFEEVPVSWPNPALPVIAPVGNYTSDDRDIRHNPPGGSPALNTFLKPFSSNNK